jgi:PST family polysaccharide transporter
MAVKLTKVIPCSIRELRAGLAQRPELRNVLSNAGWLFAGYVSRYGLTFLVELWMARYLGPQQFGLYNYAIAFVALLAPLSTLGINNVIVRDIVRDPSRRDETLGAALALRLISGLLVWPGSIIIVSLIRPGDGLIKWMVGIIATGAIFQSFDVIEQWFQSQVKSKFTALARSSALLVVTFLRVALIRTRAPLIFFAYAALLESVLAAAGLTIAYQSREGGVSKWRPRYDRARTLVQESWPLLLSSISIMIYMKIDQIMLGEWSGDHAVGIYSVAVRLSEVWYLIPVIICHSLLPSIVEAKKVSERLYLRRLQRLFDLLSAVAYPIAIPMAFLSGRLVTTLFGQPYAEAGPVLAIHIWAGVSVFLGVAKESYMITEGLTKFSMAMTFGGAVINVALNCLLIPAYGAMGAAVATVIAYSFAGVLFSLFFTRTRAVGLMMLKSLLPLRFRL